MTKEPVTIMCKVCDRVLDGFFFEDTRTEIKTLDGKLVGVVGEYRGKKSYMHVGCFNGIKAEEVLNKK
jgi:hypothetical protein